MSTTTGHVRGKIDFTGLNKLGKTLAVLFAILLLFNMAGRLLATKWSETAVNGDPPTTSSQGHVYVGDPVQTTRTLYQAARPNIIKPGEAVEMIPIRGRKIRFLNDLDGLRFKIYNRAGKVIKVNDGQGNLVEETPHLTDWGAYKPEYLSFRVTRETTEAKEWIINWWH